MGRNLDKLLKIGSAPTASGSPSVLIENQRLASALASDLSALLSARNGFHAFEAALQVYPVQSEGEVLGILDWNRRETWKHEYQGLADDFLCFAQDVFGNQFALREDKVILFECETGRQSAFATSMEDWSEKVLASYDVATGYSFARSWQLANRPLAPGERLFPVKPFTIGGEYNTHNMRAMDGTALLRFFGNFALQVRDKPEGANVRLTTGH